MWDEVLGTPIKKMAVEIIEQVRSVEGLDGLLRNHTRDLRLRGRLLAHGVQDLVAQKTTRGAR